MSDRYDLILRKGSLVLPEQVKVLDVAISDGKIVEIAEEIAGSAGETLDMQGKTLFPGTFDGHVHFNDPGRTEWETIRTGSAALAAGGAVSFIDMPLNCHPCTLDAKQLQRKLAVAEKDSLVDFGFWGGLTPDNINHLEELADCGVVGFKAFACYSGIPEFQGIDDYTALKGMEQLKKLNLPLMVHCENALLTKKLAEDEIAAGREDAWAYFAAHAPVTETESVSRMIALAVETGCKLIIAHVSLARSVELIMAAKLQGVDVCCETIGQYLMLTDEMVAALGPVAKCSPPVRNAANQQQMWGCAARGEIDFISSDHSPCDPELKAGSFMKAWGGISSCQTTLTGLLTHACHERKMPLPEIARLTSQNIAEITGIQGKGKIATGYDADFAIVDMNDSYILKAEDLFYKHQVSPYVGMTFQGAVVQTILRGKTIFKDGEIVSLPMGRFLKPVR